MTDFCEISKYPVNEETLIAILREHIRVAVVGLSPKKERYSNMVAAFLKVKGFRIFPVNPGHDQILGEKAYKSLKDIPEKVGIVVIFRRPEAVPEIVNDAIGIGAKVIWMQRGIVHNEAAENAMNAGLRVIMDRCMKVEAEKYGISHVKS